MARARRSGKAGIKVARLERNLEAGRIDPVYLVTGTEDYLRRRAYQAICSAVRGDERDGSGLALERYDADRTSIAEIIDAARSMSLFLPVEDRPVRLVWVSGLKVNTGAETGLLKDYLEAPVVATCLGFEAPSVDARRAATKALFQHATVVDCAPLQRVSDVRRWIDREAGARGLEIRPEAMAYLLEMTGNDLQQLSQELDKVELFVGDGGMVAAENFEALLGRSREHSVFELTDLLIQAEGSRALGVLNRLLDDGEEPIRLLAMITWAVRQLVTANDLAARGCPERELLGQLGGRWDQRRAVVARARRMSAGALESILVACAEADELVKVRRGAAGRGVLESICRDLTAA